MRVSFFRSEKDNSAAPGDLSWEQLRAVLRTPQTGDKFGPAWSPATFRENKRAKGNVEAVHVAVFDLDKLTPGEFLDTARRVDSTPFAACIHTTHSHTDEKPSARLVLALSRSVLPGEWDRVRSGLIKLYSLQADAQTKDSSRIYFLPRVPPGGKFLFAEKEGDPVPVETILELEGGPLIPEGFGVQTVAAPSVVFPDGSVDIQRVRDCMASVAKPESRALMRKVLNGEEIAPDGERDGAFLRAAGVAVGCAPKGTPLSVFAEIFRPTCNVTPHNHPERGSWHEIVAAKLERCIDDRAKRDAARSAVLEAAAYSLARDSAKVRQHDPNAPEQEDVEEVIGPYPEADLARWASENGCDLVTDFDRRWIIQHAGAFYIFVEGRYLSPIPQQSFRGSVYRDLARAPIKIYEESINGQPPKRRPEREILDEYSSVARTVTASISAQKSSYDPRTQTFIEAVTPIRPLAAREHPEIHRWLELLGGPKLLDWVAAIATLDRPACAIYFDGTSGAGKSRFAEGLSRLWHKGGPTELGTVLNNFNEGLARCPLLFADEQLPKVPGMTARLRELIGSSSRTLNRKFLPTVSLEGCVRLILAGNNDRLLDTGEDLSQNDLDAVAARFLYLKVNHEPRDYLNSLKQRDPEILGRWVLDDMIAEHALWLRKSRVVVPGARFIVQGDVTEFHAHLAVSSGLASQVCEWLVRYLSDPITATQVNPGILEGEGEVWVNPESLGRAQTWESRMPASNVPPSYKLARSLKTLSLKPETDLATVGGQSMQYYRILPEILASWAKREGVGNADLIRTRLSKPNPLLKGAPK